MEIFNYCNQCKKSLNCNNFDKKKNGSYYTRCKVCRKNHNDNERKKYVKKICSGRNLCNDINCSHCFNKSFASYDGITENGKLKVDCWHHTKNGNMKPRQVIKCSGKKYWFQCDVCNHDFDSSLDNVSGSKNRWCPYCANKKLCNEDECSNCYNSSFASYDKKTVNGKLKVDCWHSTKNGELTPRDIAKHSNKKYWFQCDVCNHDFDSVLYSVSRNNTWCPYCANKKLCSDINCNECLNKSFASYNEKMVNGKLKVDCWHPTKNGNMKPRQVTKCSDKKYWFQCDVCNHDFDSSLANVSGSNNWCPYCANQKLCDEDECSHCFNKSFASYDGITENGKLKVDCWHHTKNGNMKPRDVTKGTDKKCWFQCDVCNHDFDSRIASVSGSKNQWCPYCANKKLCNEDECSNCYNSSFASYDKKTVNGKLKVDCWNHTKNDELTPRDVAKHSGKKYWFQCDVCNHDFDSALDCVSGSDNTWCPYCANRKLCDEDECSHCYNNCFASYNEKTFNEKLKVDCWHPTKNGNMKPRQVTKCSDKKYWFQCDVCNHDFDSSLANVSGSNNWCPYCANRKLCNEDECSNCYNSSFASYDKKTVNGKLKVDCWNHTKNDELTPRDVAKHSGKKYWFQCDVCNHDFDSALNFVSGSNNTWCPYCANKKLCNEDECSNCYNSSFASYDKKTVNGKLKVDCWHHTKNDELTPRDAAKYSNKKYWFQCDVCNHDFDSLLANVSGSKNRWCPYCKNKTELKLYNWLLKQPNIKNVKREYQPKWCSTKYKYINKKKELKERRYQYRYDFLITFINKKKLIIELDGAQHYKQVMNWKNPLENQIRDKYKEFLAKKHKIPLTRCIQEDVYMDRNNWEQKLKRKLQKYN